MRKDIIVFDIDGTLSLVGDRKKCLEGPKKDWDQFYARCAEDEINAPIAELMEDILFNVGTYEIVLVTGRRESCRQATEWWFEKHFGISPQVEQLFMRPDGDYRHDTLVKPELVAPFMDRIKMVFEDRDSMVKKWRELGICCLQVAEGKF